MVRSILVPVDGSDCANRAARLAAYLASKTGAKLTLLHAYDAPTAAVLGLASMSDPDAQQVIARLADGSFERAREQLVDFDVTVETHVAVGHPAQEIVNYARQHHSQLIVMGTRGLTPLQETMLGSVSDYVLRHAPCPVTIHH